MVNPLLPIQGLSSSGDLEWVSFETIVSGRIVVCGMPPSSMRRPCPHRDGASCNFGRNDGRLCLSRVEVAVFRFARLPDLVLRVRQLREPLRQCDDNQLREAFSALRLERQRPWTAGHAEQISQSLSIGSEAIRRVFGFELHDVQVQGAAEVAQGRVVQMQTGEGKTMVAALAAIHRALSGRGVHVITTSSYLATRDADELRPVFERLGISLGVLSPSDDQAKSRRAYAADITYGPGYQFGFDYLRDQLALRSMNDVRLGDELRAEINGVPTRWVPLRQRPRELAIIDEIDSVLLDEASTPLILSGPASAHDDPLAYLLARDCVERFVEGIDFRFDPNLSRIMISVAAVTRSQHELDSQRGIQLSRPWATYLRNAVQARDRLFRDEHYAVVDGEIYIVDQNTGRLFADRSWRDGLHQAVQAKEHVEITPSESSLARITRQRYFQQYKYLAGLTGTAVGAESEFQRVYSLKVVPISTARPCLRRIEPLRAFDSLATKRRAIAADTRIRHQCGQPVLVGTRTIDESRRISEELEALSVPHVVLNGLQDADEASVVAQAGQLGAVTIATNMAGRGTDIKLSHEARAAGGLHVVVSEPHPLSRVDRQLVGRSSRQGDPGSAQTFLSADDPLLVEHAPRLADRIRRRADSDGEYRCDLSADVFQIQQRVEAEQARQRSTLLKQDVRLDGVRRVLSGAESV